MTDIDFDELDRAVSSAIGPNKAVSKTVESPDAVPVSTSNPASSTNSSLAERRSSGRFMDVVHPSSDMRSNTPVQPRPVKQDDETISPAKTPEPPKADGLTSADPNPVSSEVSTKDSNAPLESPFLANTKVEKRPLGAFSNEVHSSEPATFVSDEQSTDEPKPEPAVGEPTKNNTETDNSDSDTPMPAELQPGLLSIEANEDSESAQKDTPQSTPTPEPSEPIGPTSITPQYTPQPSTGDKPVENVFDAAEYKKPQPHTSKKKAGWLVVVWILTLLIVGAGIGAAVYFFVLPRL